MARRQIPEVAFQIDIPLRPGAEIDEDILACAGGQRRFGDRLYRRQTGAAGQQQHGPGVAGPVMAGADWPAQSNRIAHRQIFHDMGCGRAAGHVTNVEFQISVPWRRGHGEIPGRQTSERQLGILARRVIERPAAHHFQPHNADIVGRRLDLRDPALQPAAGVDGGVLGGDRLNFAVGPGNRAAGEDQAARLLLFRKRKLRIGRHFHLARNQMRFAGTAIARPATVRIIDSRRQHRFQYGAAHGNLERGGGPAFGHSQQNIIAHIDVLTRARSSAIDRLQ